MGRIRSIKPEFFTDSKTGRLSGDATKLFVGLWNHCDDYGVIEFDPDQIRVLVLPYATSTDAVVHPLTDELFPLGLVQMFFLIPEDGDPGVSRRAYLWVKNFLKHQKIDHPSRPLLKGWDKTTTPDNYVPEHAQVSYQHSPSPHRALGNPRESARGLAPEGRGEEGNGEERIKKESTGAVAKGDSVLITTRPPATLDAPLPAANQEMVQTVQLKPIKHMSRDQLEARRNQLKKLLDP